MKTRLTEPFGIRHPSLSAPMALAKGRKFGLGFITWALDRAPQALDALRGVPWPQEFSFRVLKNKFTDEWAHREAEAAASRGSLASVYAGAREERGFGYLLTVVGEAAGLLHDPPNAASIIESMVAQAESLLKRGASLDFRASRAGS